MERKDKEMGKTRRKHVGKDDEDKIKCPRDAKIKGVGNTHELWQLHKLLPGT